MTIASQIISSQTSDVRIIDEKVTISPAQKLLRQHKIYHDLTESKITTHPEAQTKKSFSCLELLRKSINYILNLLCCAWCRKKKAKEQAVTQEVAPPKKLPPLPHDQITFGSPEQPYQTWEALADDLKKKASELGISKYNSKAHYSLTIYGKQDLQIIEDPGILAFNPMKVIFVGPSLANGVCHSGDNPLFEQFGGRPEWQGLDESEHLTPFKVIETVSSVQEALNRNHPRMDDGRFCHKLYYVAAAPSKS